MFLFLYACTQPKMGKIKLRYGCNCGILQEIIVFEG